MTVRKILRANLLFVVIVLAFNLLFFLQQPDYTVMEQGYGAFNGAGPVFVMTLLILSFLLCLFSLPGAGFSLSLGGYLWGLEYLVLGALVLFLSSWAAYPFSKRIKKKSALFRRVLSAQSWSDFVGSDVLLYFLRMNPAVPFLFFAAFDDRKLNSKFLTGLFIASTFHAFIYVFIGWNVKAGVLGAGTLSIYTSLFMVLTVLPVLLIVLFQNSKKQTNKN